MCDLSKYKSTGYCRGKSKLRTVTSTKWELPIPGSKPYWDKICNDLEKRKEHVSESSYPPSPSPDAITDPYFVVNCHKSTLNKCNYIVDPIVQISPPTPMRMAPQSPVLMIPENTIINENGVDLENDNKVLTKPKSSESKDAKFDEVPVCMTEFLKDNSLRSKKYCQLHRNAPPLKIFDDNLKRFLPKKPMMTKLTSAKVQPILSADVVDMSKLHSNKSCPLRGHTSSKDRVEFDISLTENKNRSSRSLRRPKTGGSDKKGKGNFYQFLKVPKFTYANFDSRSNIEMTNKKSESKSKIIESNLNYMFSIPKLDDLVVDQSMISETAVMADLEPQKEFQAIADGGHAHSQELDACKLETVNLHETRSVEMLQEFSTSESPIPKFRENFKPMARRSMTLPRLSKELSVALDAAKKTNEHGRIPRTITDDNKLQDKPKKDFLKVPKLGAISSYPSFSKLTPGDSVESEEGQRLVVQGPTGNIGYQGTENTDDQIHSTKRDFLKVPKLSMMSSYPSFNSLIPDSLDSDDNAIGGSDQVPQISVFSNSRPTISSVSSDLMTNRNTEASPPQNEKPRRRRSLKDSVRYAYRALKFITPNKNLDFQPQSYDPPKKSGSSSGSSDSSGVSKYSKFEPAIKLLTYEDVETDRPTIRSLSSSTYGTVNSRLKKRASQYLGSEYVFSSSKTRPPTASTTIPSLTRSTSGPTLDFQEPVFVRPSEKVLNKLPKMSIFPRRKYDKCFACLHKAFEEPVKPRRELPLATWNAVMKEPVLTFSESESSSIDLPDVKDFIESQSDFDDNWTEILGSRNKSTIMEKSEWKSSKGSLRTNLDCHKSRQPFFRPLEESQSVKSDAKSDNLRRNLSTKDLIATNIHPRPVSLSSEHSKPSSLSGHSSESEEPQVQSKPPVPTSECLTSPFAPLHWAPNLEPLKSLKFRKPVSMHGRAVSITKTQDDSTDDDNANDFRSTRKENKLNNASGRRVADKNQESTMDSSSKSIIKQPSIVAKIVTSQLSTIASLSKTQSKVDLLSGDSKSENQTKLQIQELSSDPADERQRKDSKESQNKEAMSGKPTILQDDEKQTANLKTHLQSVDGSINQKTSVESVERSSSNSPLPRITEQSTENDGPDGHLEADKLTEKALLEGVDSSKVQEEEPHFERSEDLTTESTCEIYSSEMVMKVLEKCVDENRTPLEMLEALNAVATQNGPFASSVLITNPEIARSAKIAKNLMKLLIGSKKYLNPDTFSPHLEFSSPQIPLCNPRQLQRVLPEKTYNLVARILGMPVEPVNQKSDFKPGYPAKNKFRLKRSVKLNDSWDMFVHPPSTRGIRKLTIDADDFEYPQQSPYALFMNKPRRKAIKWRPLTERDMLGYDPEATLNMRAIRVTNKICEDFCKWLRGLGGGHGEDIDEEILRDMFQIEFTAEACRTMQVLIKEIPMVPITVALARNTPGAGELALTRRHLIRDAEAESRPKKIIGFGTMLPRTHRFIPPKNRVDERWLQCENVPRDLETMATVWKEITHLDSVKGFLAWLKSHPGVRPPKILTEAYAKKETLTRPPPSEETSGHIELEIDQIESLKVGDVE